MTIGSTAGRRGGGSYGAAEAAPVSRTANGRAGTPADVAAAVAFPVSPEAGRVTGQVVAVDGGAHLGR